MHPFDKYPGFNFFDATMFAIMIPSAVMISPSLALAWKKGFFSVIEHSDKRAGTWNGSRKVQAAIYIFCFLFANALTACLLTLTNYSEVLPGGSDSITILRAIIMMSVSLTLGVLSTLPIFVSMLFFYYRKRPLAIWGGPGNFSMIFFNGVLFTALLFLLVPTTQVFLVSCGLVQGSLFLLRDMMGVSIALSTVPLSLLPMVLLCAGNPPFWESHRASQMLNGLPISDESLKIVSDEKLQALADAARKMGNFDVAEIVSRHLLQRAENS